MLEEITCLDRRGAQHSHAQGSCSFTHLETQIYVPIQTQHLGEEASMKRVHFLWESQASGKDHGIEPWNSWSGKRPSKCNLVLPVHPSTAPWLQQPWEYFHRSPEQGLNTSPDP